MATEIERKFLVVGNAWRESSPEVCRQGYLNRDKHRTVRVRVIGDKAYLTVKGLTRNATRTEFEYQVPVVEAEQLLDLCDGPLLEKNRFYVTHAGMTWEIDEFKGANAGLIVAEIELESEGQLFERPDWIGREVTNDKRFYNSRLASEPFTTWKDGDTG